MINSNAFRPRERDAVYRAIFERRDIRGEFSSQDIPEAVLMNLLRAAHHAGSVGFMQPWNFIVVRDKDIKKKVKAIFQKANAKAAQNYNGHKRRQYDAMKLEGIEETPVNICITCDPQRGGPYVLGRNTIKATDLFSTCCAIQNLWLAARAEGIGVGWVSIMNNHALKKVLKIPRHIKPVAYLCVGYVTQFPLKPMLETNGWRKRLALKDLIFFNTWEGR